MVTQEQAQEFYSIMQQQTDKEWRSHNDHTVTPQRRMCAVLYVSDRINEEIGTPDFKKRFGFTSPQVAFMFTLNDRSKTRAEAHNLIERYVDTLVVGD